MAPGNTDRDDGQDVLVKEDTKSKQDCIDLCYAVKGAYGCELGRGGSCSVHTKPVIKGSGTSGYTCWVYQGMVIDKS